MNIYDRIVKDATDAILEKIPNELKALLGSLEETFKSVVKSSLEHFEIVSKEEFDIQNKILLKTRQKVDSLEKKIEEMLKNQTNPSS